MWDYIARWFEECCRFVVIQGAVPFAPLASHPFQTQMLNQITSSRLRIIEQMLQEDGEQQCATTL